MQQELKAPKMSTSLVARRLNCSEGTVRLLEQRGVLPAERTAGGMRLFDRDAVERLATKRQRVKRHEV
jgi:excisionase family DNA binding protein